MKLGRFTVCAVSALALAASLSACNAKADEAPSKNDTTQSASKNLKAKPAEGEGGLTGGGGGFGDAQNAPEKLSANDAAEAELAGAFEKAKISDGAKWAKTVVENRPYPEDDIFIKKLREAMGKAGASEDVQDQVVSQLSVEKGAKK